MNESDFDNTNFDEQRPKKRSLVWKFFEKINRNRVRCRVCRHEQNYQGTTGNILRHLKARHDLDATLKGQQDPRNQQRIIELSKMTFPIEEEEIKFECKPKIRKSSICSDSSNIAMGDNNANQAFNENSNNMFYESIPELEEDSFDNTYLGNDVQHRKSLRRIKLEEDRIIAETEYFREKAAYFRIQKHLTALQAKKIKVELEQITAESKT